MIIRSRVMRIFALLAMTTFSFADSLGDLLPPPNLPRLHLHNSLTSLKEPFAPLAPPTVKMYSCGPTIYDRAHVGNFRSFLASDILKRALQLLNFDVDHVCNLTDIDDKIIRRCNAEDRSLRSLTEEYEQCFHADLSRLNVVPARIYPRATGEIDTIVEMISTLVEKGLAYRAESDGSYYYRVDKFDGYGTNLVNLASFDASEVASDDVGGSNSRDFALWKAPKAGFEKDDALFDTALGRGRPGWHIECSALIQKHLGDQIDLHLGGSDLKFPHHENEIAQSEGYSGKKFCGCWVHNGFVTVGSEKMSKSLGNFKTLDDMCPRGRDVRAFRFGVVSSYYRGPLRLTDEVMTSNRRAIDRFDKVYVKLKALDAVVVGEAATTPLCNLAIMQRQIFVDALADDLATPRCAAALFAVIKACEKEFRNTTTLDFVGLHACKEVIHFMDEGLFGIIYEASDALEGGEGGEGAPDDIVQLAEERKRAKTDRNFAKADKVREMILAAGWTVKDVAGGNYELTRTTN